MEEQRKKRPNAFAVMMEAAARAPSPTKKPKFENAFDVMMHSAEKPGAFDPALDMEALNKNRILKQFVVNALRSDGDEDTKQASAKEEEEDPGVTRALGFLYDHRDDPDSSFEDSDEEDNKLIEEEEITPVPPEKRALMSTLKPPPTSPSTNAAIQSVVVHFKTESSWDMVVGISFYYSDGVEMRFGDTWGRKKAVVNLDSGEHIVGVLPVSNDYRDFKCAVRFRTSKGRQLYATPPDGNKCDDRRKWMDRQEDKSELKCPPGTVVRSIEWCESKLTVKGLETVLISEFEQATGRIPSLASLAQAKYESYLQENALQVQKEGRSRLNRLHEDEKRKIWQVYSEESMNLSRSDEANVVRQLRALLEKAEENLIDKALKHLVTADKRRDAILENISNERNTARAEWEEKKSEILTEHLSFLVDHSETGPNDGCNALLLCVSESCRKTYRPNDLPESKRCIFPGCTFILSNCGCETHTCTVCHQTVCWEHEDAHNRRCHEPARRKCGFSWGGGLHPAFCHKETDDESRCCFSCSTRCCPRCSASCRCESVWCKKCLERREIVGSCCFHCSFRRR